MLSISLATVGVDTCRAISGIRAFATFPMVCASAKALPNEPEVSFAAFCILVEKRASSGSEGNVNMPGVVKPMPVGQVC